VGPLAADSSRLGGEPGAGRFDRKVMLAQVSKLQAGQGVHGITSTGIWSWSIEQTRVKIWISN
jgi:hypothetical protein